jgi:enoyl-CoA hydratase
MNDLTHEIRDRTLWIRFNRPQARNALTFGMYEGLAELCRGVPVDGSLNAVVISGAGAKAFAAGTDMTQFRAFDSAQDALDYEATSRASAPCWAPDGYARSFSPPA